MKKVKNSIVKHNKSLLILLIGLVLIIIGLTIYIFINKDETPDTTTYKQIQVNNEVENGTTCRSNNIKTDEIDIKLKFCNENKVIILDSSNIATDSIETDSDTDSTDTTETDSDTDTYNCTQDSIIEKTLNIENVVDFYSSYNYTENSYVYYILNNKGKVFTTTEENIISKNYDVTLLEDLENIVDIEEYTTYENNTNMYTLDLYAIDENGELHILRNIY